jgi:hypothetical protein
MGLDTKTYWLTHRQSQCDFDFDLSLVIWYSGGEEKNLCVVFGVCNSVRLL